MKIKEKLKNEIGIEEFRIAKSVKESIDELQEIIVDGDDDNNRWDSVTENILEAIKSVAEMNCDYLIEESDRELFLVFEQEKQKEEAQKKWENIFPFLKVEDAGYCLTKKRHGCYPEIEDEEYEDFIPLEFISSLVGENYEIDTLDDFLNFYKGVLSEEDDKDQERKVRVFLEELEKQKEEYGGDEVVKIDTGGLIIDSNLGHRNEITSFDEDVYTYKVTYKFKLTIK